MASQDTFFKVKTGLGVGTDTLYADAVSKQVSIGASEGTYTLDVYGTIYGDQDLLIDNSVGVGTTIPVQRLDVRGTGIASAIGIAVTNPSQIFQVNTSNTSPVVITGLGSFGIKTVSPTHPFQLVGDLPEEGIVFTGLSSIGIRVQDPLYDFHYKTRNLDYDIVISDTGFIGINNITPSYNLDITGGARVSGFATITDAYIGVATVGFATITDSYLGITTVGFATITDAYAGIATVGFATITDSYLGITTVGFATITDSYLGISTVGFATITDAYVGVATVGFATITDSYLGITTVGFATITDSYLGITTVGFATITNAYVGVATVGFATITNEYVGISTVGFSTITYAYVGVATVGFATITNEYVGISTITDAYIDVATVGFATITDSYLGITTVGFATITDSYLGITTVGFATITDSYLGITTVGFATITDSYVGVATVGFATITDSYLGITTVGFATITNAYVGISTIGIATITQEKVVVSEIGNLLVTGITTTARLDVGIGATLIRARSLGITSVYDNLDNLVKEIHPIVGIGTTQPTRTLDVAGDIRVRGEVIDSNNNVGFGYSVLGAKALGVSGRFIDGANLLLRNKDFIAEEVVGFITSKYGPFGENGYLFDYGTVGVATGKVKCKRDIGLIIDSIAFDISKGGNSKSVGAGLSYYNGVVLQYLDDDPDTADILGQDYVKTATLAGISSITSLATYVINNVQYPTSYQYGPYYGRNSDAANLLETNKTFIAQYAVAKLLNDNPSFVIPTGNESCIRDITLVLDAIIYNLRYTGNDKVWDAAKLYIDNDYLQGEEAQSIIAFNNARDAAVSVMRNEAVSLSGISQPYLSIITKPQVTDESIIPDTENPACATVASAIFSFIGIITTAIDTGSISATRTPAIEGVSQLIDLEIAADGDSNTSIDGCANVLSAIHSCVGIVTTIIDQGPGAAPNINYPSSQLVWQPPGPRIGNEWFVNKLGDDSNGGTGPGDAFLTIKRAAQFAQPGDTIKVYAGLYIEDAPISLNERVAVVGEDLRRTLVTTRDLTDLFYVKRGCYISQMSFIGESNPGKAMVSFPTRGYGYADGTEENWISPYVQNCTNFVPDSIGMRIDGDRAGGFKSMVLDAYTQYNQGGIGVSITNFGYAQLVSLFTICCDTAVYCDTGGVCDLNNSNSSFGNYGLVSNGATPLQFTGTVVSDPNQSGIDNVDSLTINVGVGASQAFKDAVDILRANKDFIAAEVVGFITSTSTSEVFPGVTPPFGANGPNFDYGGSVKGKEFCKRDSKIIVESICSDLLNLGNIKSIEAGLAYRDSEDGSLTYLNETIPTPVGFTAGYVKDAEISAIKFIAGISTYIIANGDVPVSFQGMTGAYSQVKIPGASTSQFTGPFIASRAGIITSIIGIGTEAVPIKILPKGQRPYDGQIAYIDTQYYKINRIEIINPGSGYDPNIPVEVSISLPPENSEYFVPAEAAVFENNINSNGTIAAVELIVSGTGYTSTPPTVEIAGPPGVGTTATARAVMEKIFFNPISATPVSVGGTTTVSFDEFITYSPLIGIGDTVYFYQSSKIIASSITFEYVGTGINIVNAIPSKGAVPITENQIVATNGGKVPFTSTDQGGNFRISEGITINQNTGTISGQAFSKSLQAEVTPLIIALQQ